MEDAFDDRGTFYELLKAIAFEGAMEILVGVGKSRDPTICMYAVGFAKGYQFGFADGVEGLDPAFLNGKGQR